MDDVLTLILGGGRGVPLYPLTKHRSEPAVPIAGKYRLIDIPISNCINSGLHRIYVLTQYLSVSLHRHIANTYRFAPFSAGFVSVLAAQQTNEAANWYQGTADALRQNLRYIQEDKCTEVLILSGDQLYRMDFRALIEEHRKRQALLTIAATPVRADETATLGVLRIGPGGEVLELVEKPQTRAEREHLRLPGGWLDARGVAPTGREYLASMGIYVVNRDALTRLLGAATETKDLVRDIFPRVLGRERVGTYLFTDYWRDLGSVRSYHEGNLALADEQPPFDFFAPAGVIYTRMRDLPAARVGGATLHTCVVADGCVVFAGADVAHSILGVRSRIGRNVRVRDSVINGATHFETDEERAANAARGVPSFTVGDGSVIEHAILDKDCRVGRNVKIVNARGVRDDEGDNYVIRDGIVVIPSRAVVPDGTVI